MSVTQPILKPRCTKETRRLTWWQPAWNVACQKDQAEPQRGWITTMGVIICLQHHLKRTARTSSLQLLRKTWKYLNNEMQVMPQVVNKPGAPKAAALPIAFSELMHTVLPDGAKTAYLLLLPFIWRRKRLGGLYPDGRIPFPWGEHDDFIQKLIDASDQVLPVLGFIGNVVEHLQGKDRLHGDMVCISCSPDSRGNYQVLFYKPNLFVLQKVSGHSAQGCVNLRKAPSFGWSFNNRSSFLNSIFLIFSKISVSNLLKMLLKQLTVLLTQKKFSFSYK